MSATNLHTSPNKSFQLYEESLRQIVRGKYRLRILWDLQDGPQRFGRIKKRLDNGTPPALGIAPKVLSRQLKALAEFGLVRRKAYEAIPPRVEYGLTPLGRTLLPIISRLRDWGIRHAQPNSFLANHLHVGGILVGAA